MESRDEGSELILLDVLLFIDEENSRGSCSLRGGTDLLQKGAQVSLQISVISYPWLGLEIEPNFQIVVLELQCLRETGEGPETTLL